MMNNDEDHHYDIHHIRQQQQEQQQQQQHHHEHQMVRNIASAVEEYAAGLTRNAKFLEETEVESSVAVFHNSEIVLGKLLGSGGFSQVYEASAFNLLQTSPSSAASEMNLARRIIESTAIDHRGQTTYALKHLDKKLLQNPDEFCAAAADLYVEAKYMSRFNHPNILKLRGMANGGTSAFREGRHNAFFLLTDRLVDTLDDRIERWATERTPLGPMDSRLVLKTNIALQMALALEYLHERRIVFRDLKPHNIGFKSDDTVQLFDFGLCRELPTPAQPMNQDETYKMSEAGTKRYMAVEIYKNMGSRYNLKADCYSWAAVFYEMLSLQKPYNGISDEQFQTFVLGQGLRPQLSQLQLPRKIEHLVQQGWQHNHVQRPSIKVIRLGLQQIIADWESQQRRQEQQQQQQQQVLSVAAVHPMLAPNILHRTISSMPVVARNMDCPSLPAGWSCANTMVQQQHQHQSQQLQQAVVSAQISLPPPVFTFEQDMPCTTKRTVKRASTDVTLTTENSTTGRFDDEELSISTFDYSLSSLMDLVDDPSTEPTLPPAIETGGYGFSNTLEF